MTGRHEYHSNFACARRQWARAQRAHDAGDGGLPGPFDRIDWFEALHGAVFPDARPEILRAEAMDGECWLFLLRDGVGLRALANYYSFRWRPICVGDGAGSLREAAAALKRHAATLDLAPMAPGDAAELVAALRHANWLVEACESGTSHWLSPAGRSFANWWSQRPGALRSTVRRKARMGRVAIAIHDRFDDRLWDEYEAVYRASWKPAESHPAFLRAWARRAGQEGTLRLGLARIGGVAVAAQFWLIDGGSAYIVKLAHASGHDALSPGTLLSHAMFERAFDVEGVSRIDFGTGDDGYKRDWMEQSAPLVTVRAWNPSRPAAWPGLVRSSVKRVATRLGLR